MRHMFALLFGTIVGVGWIAASGEWILQAGPLGSILAFAGGAAVMTLIGLCYAELMAALPEVPGAIGYAERAFGPAMAFATGWLLTLSYAATVAFFVVTLPWLLEVIVPGLAGPVLYHSFGADVHLGPTAVAVGVGVVIAWTNHRGAQTASRAQSGIVGIKIGLMIILGAAAASGGHVSNLEPPFGDPRGHRIGDGLLAVVITTPFWFGGFDVLPQAMRERSGDLDLTKLGRLIGLTTFAALVFYVLIILSTAALATRPALAASPLPAYTAFKDGLGSPTLATGVIALGMLGIVSAWNATIFSTARIVRTLARAAFIPTWLGDDHSRHATPSRAIWLVSALSVALGLSGPGAVTPLITAASITLVLTFAILCAALLRLRAKEPDLDRPYRIRSVWLVYIAIALSLGLLLLSVDDALPTQLSSHVPLAFIVVTAWSAGGWMVWRARSSRRT